MARRHRIKHDSEIVVEEAHNPHIAIELPKRRVKDAFQIRGRSFLDPRDRQLEKLENLGDPLVLLKDVIDWEMFRSELDRIYEKERKSAAGRKPLDVVLMFKIMILQRLYNMSDDQAEYQIRDRASFQRFLGLNIEDGSPDAKTIWLFRERLKGLERDLFFRFDRYLSDTGLTAKGGQIIDATFIDAPRQRNTREENETIKNGNVPEEWKNQPNMLAQKDLEAEWAKKNDETHYGYKDHANVDACHKLIRDYTVTGASVHDSLMLDDILDETQGRAVYADSAYRSNAQEQRIDAMGLLSLIHERSYRNTPLTEDQKAANHEKSKIRVRVEHVFGFFHTSMNRATFIRTIGSARACVVIGLSNLTYNLARFLQIKKAEARMIG
jgi:IS5 family transposase